MWDKAALAKLLPSRSAPEVLAAVQASRRSSASVTVAPGRMPWIAATYRDSVSPRSPANTPSSAARFPAARLASRRCPPRCLRSAARSSGTSGTLATASLVPMRERHGRFGDADQGKFTLAADP